MKEVDIKPATDMDGQIFNEVKQEYDYMVSKGLLPDNMTIQELMDKACNNLNKKKNNDR